MACFGQELYSWCGFCMSVNRPCDLIRCNPVSSIHTDAWLSTGSWEEEQDEDVPVGRAPRSLFSPCFSCQLALTGAMRVLLVCAKTSACVAGVTTEPYYSWILLTICACDKSLWFYHRLPADTRAHCKRDDVILPQRLGNIGGIIMQCQRQNVCVRIEGEQVIVWQIQQLYSRTLTVCLWVSTVNNLCK